MQSQFVPRGDDVDLTNCDREPIHTPGSVQSHGALFALDRTTERVLAASSNCEAFIGETLDQCTNALATDVFGDVGADAMRKLALTLTSGGDALNVLLPKSGHLALMHRAGDTVFVELEASDTANLNLLGVTRDAVRRLAVATDVQHISDTAAADIHALTGYDRVMVYRFDSQGDGSVIAEARNPVVEGFLGLHYPASDIPRQARALYRTTMLRLIVDVDASPARLEPVFDPRDGEPWDLGRAILRSTSPIHLEYLRNMRVAATLTISLMRDGELWGLIACHHETPKYVGPDVRAAVETLGLALVSRIVQMEDARLHQAQADAQRALMGLVTRGARDLASIARDDAFFSALDVHGVAVAGAEPASSGLVLAPERLAALIAWLSERSGSAAFVTDSLAKLNPAFAGDAAVASGVYARRVGTSWFVAFRGADVRVVDWGGDPAKAVDTDGDHISPRTSFALWREDIRNRAMPWESWTIAALEGALQWTNPGPAT